MDDEFVCYKKGWGIWGCKEGVEAHGVAIAELGLLGGLLIMVAMFCLLMISSLLLCGFRTRPDRNE
jgi:hypothetical protein